MRKKLENIWYHYKAILIIGFLILFYAVYFFVQKIGNTEPDFSAAIISETFFSEEQLLSLQNALGSVVGDTNGDGETTVRISTYHLALCREGQDINELSALDADLVGKVSTMFLVDDPEAFETATNGICLAKDAFSVSTAKHFSGLGFDTLSVLIRKDLPSAGIAENAFKSD